MKVAVITDNGRSVSAHFGRARTYEVFTIEDGQITAHDIRERDLQHHEHGQGHQHDHEHDHEHDHDHDHDHDHEDHTPGHGFGHRAAERHAAMIAQITDCDALIVRGMGRGAYLALKEAGIRPIVTDISDIQAALAAFIDGSIVDHADRLH